jgi:hypothetical protein
MAKTFRIFPPIGIARLGEDTDFFIGPEIPGKGSTEFAAAGIGSPVSHFKDASKKKIRKQGARFHLFESDDGVTWQPAALPQTARVTWRVELTNKKSAVTRPSDPPVDPMRPVVTPANEGKVIRGGAKTVTGPNASSTEFVGKYTTTAAGGAPFQVDVALGQLQTDSAGRLIVLGGKGFSSAPLGTPIGPPYYRNPDWHDDVSDGPVDAEIEMSPGQPPIRAENSAWVIVAPPDYAPDVTGVITLYDVIVQLGIDNFAVPKPSNLAFDLDVAPIIQRVRNLRWVHKNAAWSSPKLNDPKLRNRGDADKQVREKALNIILKVEDVLQGHTDPEGPPFRFRAYQREILDSWVQGLVDDTPKQIPDALSAAGLTRAALEGAVGQGFCPGIEAGIMLLDPELYIQPFDFRLNPAVVKSGDVTALMAQPWQADFLKCNTEWWPTQRPDLAPQPGGALLQWIRGANDHALLVERSARLGFVAKQGQDQVFVESERDPTMPSTP